MPVRSALTTVPLNVVIILSEVHSLVLVYLRYSNITPSLCNIRNFPSSSRTALSLAWLPPLVVGTFQRSLLLRAENSAEKDVVLKDVHIWAVEVWNTCRRGWRCKAIYSNECSDIDRTTSLLLYPYIHYGHGVSNNHAISTIPMAKNPSNILSSGVCVAGKSGSFRASWDMWYGGCL